MKRYLISVLALVFVLSFCLPVFASDEVAEVNILEEENFIKQEYAYAYILSHNLIRYQIGSNNQLFIRQVGTGNYLKIQQIGNSNTAIVVQH